MVKEHKTKAFIVIYLDNVALSGKLGALGLTQAALVQ